MHADHVATISMFLTLYLLRNGKGKVRNMVFWGISRKNSDSASFFMFE